MCSLKEEVGPPKKKVGDNKIISTNSNSTVLTFREASEGNLNFLETKLKEVEYELLTTKSETENLKRKLDSEVTKVKKFGIETILTELLFLMDSLEAALSDGSSIEKLKEGVKLTTKQLKAILVKNNVTVLEPFNQKFDPTFHQVVSLTEDGPPNTVQSVLQKGYILWGRLLRPALVVVSKKKNNTEEKELEVND